MDNVNPSQIDLKHSAINTHLDDTSLNALVISADREDVYGLVVAFDERVALGYVESEDGSKYMFHCVSLIDGSRSVDIGQNVIFDVTAGHRGIYEATRIKKI